jgi:hypothetical protein
MFVMRSAAPTRCLNKLIAMSAYGTKQTWYLHSRMSALTGKAGIAQTYARCTSQVGNNVTICEICM